MSAVSAKSSPGPRPSPFMASAGRASGVRIANTVLTGLPCSLVTKAASSADSYEVRRMHTKSRDAATTSSLSSQPLSILTLPGHHIPATPAQCGAPETSMIGLPVRLASASPRSRVAYHWMIVPSLVVVAAVRVSGPPPRGARWASAEAQRNSDASAIEAAVRRVTMVRSIGNARRSGTECWEISGNLRANWPEISTRLSSVLLGKADHLEQPNHDPSHDQLMTNSCPTATISARDACWIGLRNCDVRTNQEHDDAKKERDHGKADREQTAG